MTPYYSEEHVWLTVEGEIATIGITIHAQEALGDVVFVDLPAVGASIEQGAVAGVVESVKAASDVFMPIGGTVTEVNETLRNDPSLANTDPMDAGWFFKVKLSQTIESAGLLNDVDYQKLTG
ncbi:GcvH Glycine cleavage system H protein (lipoate-binding) [Burkholderiaceae bacterium]